MEDKRLFSSGSRSPCDPAIMPWLGPHRSPQNALRVAILCKPLHVLQNVYSIRRSFQRTIQSLRRHSRVEENICHTKSLKMLQHLIRFADATYSIEVEA